MEQPATLAINDLANKKRDKGERVYNLSVGEPMVHGSSALLDAATRAIEQDNTRYAPARGVPGLLDAVLRWMSQEYKALYSLEEVMVTCGGKHALWLACQSLIGSGDEVLIISPYWVSYPSIIKSSGGVPVVVETFEKNDFKVSVDDLKSRATGKTSLLIFNNASNPTGVIYTREEVASILKFCKNNNITLISDEVYSGLVYDDKEYVSCASFKEYKDAVVIIQSCSKHFAMTGWRVGFLFGASNLIEKASILQSQTITGTSTVSQYVALSAIENADEITSSVNAQMQKRRDVFVSEFNKLFPKPIKAPRSALYAFVAMENLGVDSSDSVEFCKDIINRINVALVPGAPFGKDGYVRFSFGAGETEIKEALEVLAKGIL